MIYSLFLIVLYCFDKQQIILAQHHTYQHYSRHPISETIYDNETLISTSDDSNMCHLSVRCPSVSTLCK
jgi:predicted lactoylglutathione lyase